MADGLKILFMAAEMAPFAKTGGVAEVARDLPMSLRALGHDARVAIPRHARIDPTRFGLEPLLPRIDVPLEDYRAPASILTTEMDGGLPVYLVDNEKYFGRENLYGYPDDGERFIFFCRAAMEAMRKLDWQPDVVHLNNWQTAIVASWLSTIYKDDPFFHRTASLYTIHNLAYQGIFGWRILEVAGVDEYAFMHPNIEELPNVVTLMAHGILFADVINTVSPTYAREILTPEYGEKLHSLLNDRRDRLYGVLNGINYRQMDPATDPNLAQNYDLGSLDKRVANKLALQKQAGLAIDPGTPLVGFVSRLTNEKGLDILAEVVDGLMDLPMQLVVMGTGDQYYHEMFNRLARRYPGRVAVVLTFNAPLAQKIFAGSDIFLMPSRFEPSGTNQMIAMRYGSVPVVHSTGGLADTVTDFDPKTGEGTGFAFKKYTGMMLFASLVRALETYRYRETWRKIMEAGMQADHSWTSSARRYVDLYRLAVDHRAAAETPARVG